jgi:uncharacterized coiled-coil protein SlyX
MAITEFRPENQNVSQAPTLGEQSGTFGAGVQQRKNIAQGGSGRFTNLQQYVQANEANNPNAGLLQREAQARQGELGTKQQQFVSQATPIKTGLETVRSGQQFVQSALENPTQYVTPERLQQFAGFRTSGVGDIETPFNQFQALRSGLGTQQEQLASGLETIKSTPTALQNFIQSQRANPALATRGENVLDRFLTQSTQSGQQAIAGLGTTASAIRQAQVPTIASEVEALRTQAQGGPLSSADVRNLLTGKIAPEEEFVRGVNPEFLSSKVGLSGRTADPRFTDLEVAKYRQDTFNRYNQRISETENQINQLSNQIRESQNRLQQAQADLDASTDEGEDRTRKEEQVRQIARRESDNINRFQNQLNNAVFDNTTLKQGLSKMDLSLQPKLQEYESNLNKTRQEILSQYDPNRLSRIQALQQLAGTTQFDPLLQTRLT